MSLLWTEKYRPKNIQTFESSPHIKNLLKHSEPNDFPNLLLYGPPGTGKTTFAHLLTTGNVLELNASDDRGINVIRDKIKSYASTLKKDKVIILDECENLTEDAQHCLRRIIEDSKNTRFIFTTNYLSKVIAPLKSRLVKIKFTVQENTTLKKIGETEKLHFSANFYKDLFMKCNFDLRKSINILQAIAPVCNKQEVVKDDARNDDMHDNKGKVVIHGAKNDYQLMDELIGIIPKEVIIQFINTTKETYGDFINEFLYEGYSVMQFIYQLTEHDLFSDEVKKSKFYLVLSEMEEKLINGCSDETVLIKICLSMLDLI